LRAAAKVLREVPEARFAVASYNERQATLARQYVAQAGIEARVHVGHTPELILSAEACLACSGSVSLELLYHTKPSVILYQVPWWTYAVVRSLVKVRYITLVNLLTAGNIYPEPGQQGIYRPGAPEHAHVLFPEYPTCRDRSSDLAQHVITWLTDESARQRVIAGLADLKQRVGQGGASERAADYILETLRHAPSLPLPERADPPAGEYRRAS
jgi:lipid-A-disaccharide synthase